MFLNQGPTVLKLTESKTFTNGCTCSYVKNKVDGPPDYSQGRSVCVSLYLSPFFSQDFSFIVIYDLSGCGINLEIRALLECFFTIWTVAGLAVVPAVIQTGLAAVVST